MRNTQKHSDLQKVKSQYSLADKKIFSLTYSKKVKIKTAT